MTTNRVAAGTLLNLRNAVAFAIAAELVFLQHVVAGRRVLRARDARVVGRGALTGVQWNDTRALPGRLVLSVWWTVVHGSPFAILSSSCTMRTRPVTMVPAILVGRSNVVAADLRDAPISVAAAMDARTTAPTKKRDRMIPPPDLSCADALTTDVYGRRHGALDGQFGLIAQEHDAGRPAEPSRWLPE
jgi:hypothetical protein